MRVDDFAHKFKIAQMLQPGDLLLYKGTGFVNWAIRVKTWSSVDHCEIYLGDFESAGARLRGGVHTYPLRFHGLRYILRAKTPWDVEAAKAFHERCIAQDYDLAGLMSFYLAGKGHAHKAFCSEHNCRMMHEGGFYPFGRNQDADRIAPGNFLMTPLLETIYVEEDSEVRG